MESKSFDGKRSDYASETYELNDLIYKNNLTDVVVEDRSQSWWKKFLHFIEIDNGPGNKFDNVTMFLYNYDLRPVEERRRTWSWYNFINFWIADAFNVNTWQIAATGVQAGLTWWQTWITIWLGYFITGIFVAILARIGIYNHISFPVTIRISFGIFGSLWPIINRVVMACVWFGLQAWIGGECVTLMLKSIFGTNLSSKMSTFPKSEGITTDQFLGFFLFWLVSLPAMWFPPHQIRHLFTAKSYIVPFAGFGFLIWTLLKAHGAGPSIHAPTKLHGSNFGWAFVKSTMNAMANFATLITNSPDFSRFADKPSKAIKYWQYIFCIPITFSITCLIGILVSSASQVLSSEGPFWDPLDLLNTFLNHYTSGNRAGVFLLSFAFALAQLGSNISANSLSFGTDVTAMLPRFLNIRRGSYLCAALGLCICPWRFMTKSSKFTTVLSAYAVFLSSICGVAASDYYAVRRGYVDLTNLFSLKINKNDGESGESTEDSCYRYNRIGCNWRAYVAYVSGVLPNIVGFVGATGKPVPDGATKIYNLSFPVGFLVAFLVYYLLSVVLFPIRKGIPEGIKALEKSWYEEWKNVEYFDEELRSVSPVMSRAVNRVRSIKTYPATSREDIGDLTMRHPIPDWSSNKYDKEEKLLKHE